MSAPSYPVQVLRQAWAQRSQLAGPRLRADETAFLPAALSLQHTPVHPAPRRTAWALIVLFATALTWACLGTVDIVAVAPGRIILPERSKLIQPLERSVVRQVLVRDGDHVQAGQALVELDATSPSADKASLQEQLKSAHSDAQRPAALLQALAHAGTPTSAPPVLGSAGPWTAGERALAQAQLGAEWGDISARLTRLASEIQRRQAEIGTAQEVAAKLEATLPLSRRREDDFSALSARGFVASHAGQDRTRERIELEQDLATQRARLHEARAILQESENSRAAYLAETRRSLFDREAQARLRLQVALQDLAKADQRARLSTLTAPVTGTVQQLAANTVGGVVTEAQTLMVIVPDNTPGQPLVAEVTLENKDIGFVSTGQTAEIKLETFPFTRYGTVSAGVHLVTADAVFDDKRGAIFPARLLLHADALQVDGKPIRLMPGMNLTAEIKTGRRRVIDYLLSPVLQAGQESLRER